MFAGEALIIINYHRPCFLRQQKKKTDQKSEDTFGFATVNIELPREN